LGDELMEKGKDAAAADLMLLMMRMI